MGKNSMRALNDDYTSIAIRNFIERQSDLVGESLAHDQQAPGTLAEQLLAAALREHVGKKLELTGTVVNQPASTSAASTPATAAGPALKVESGKVIAASCQ